ncbi:hypothetical protein GCM10011374_41020 [Kocuria dechangensis]|uniref:DUF5668 domain-containing protein n=1 Tax=Kocuria dechangensis TaxID=1176249 RepID=A0A917H9M2_9MICC|nr:hypothetical protein [Kocuria dechangensis]GGG72061.1 hypothetical protein GCM10011374_41020 [Kocuria dechangensis]
MSRKVVGAVFGALLAALSALEATALLAVFNYAWPLALIVAGGALLWRAVGGRRSSPSARYPTPGPSSRASARGEGPHTEEELS